MTKVLPNNQIPIVSNTVQTFWVGLGKLSTFALALLSAAILSRVFEKSEYGTYRQIIYIYNTLLFIFAAGLPKVYSFFLPRYTIQQGKNIVWKITKILFLSGILFSVFLYAFSEVIALALNNTELEKGLKIFSIVPIFLLPTLGIEGIFSAYRKTIYIAIYNTISRLIMLCCIILPVILFSNTYIFAIYGWIVASFVSLIIALFFKDIPFKGVISEKASLPLKAIFRYSIPLVIASFAGIAIKAADQFYISRYFGVEVFAEFSNGFIGLPFVGIITVASSTVLLPVFSKMIHDKSSIENVIKLWKSVALKSAVLIYPLLLFFLFNSRNLMILFYSEKYESSTIYFQVSMALNFFNIIVFAPLIMALNKTQLYARIHIFYAILAWSLGYFVVILFNSPLAIALLSVFLSISLALVFYILIARILGVNILYLMPFKKLSLVILHSIISTLLIKAFSIIFLPQFNIFLQTFIAFLVYIPLLYLSGGLFKINYSLIFKPMLKGIS